MIRNFEQITCELTPDENRLIGVIILGLKRKSKANPIKGAEIVAAINGQKEKYGIKQFSEPRLRKIVNFIRSEGILPIMGTSNGYYVSYDTDELNGQIESLTQRADAIMSSANGLKKWITI
jgi:hypothetical protein